MVTNGRTTPSRSDGRSRPRARAPLYAALDLGTNNCRLLMAARSEDGGLRVVDGFSRIVRLGEGLAHTGRLSEAAMARAYQALAACAQRIEARQPVAVGCVATQACRVAKNGQTFLNRVRTDLGLSFEVITPEEEARLSVLGCANLLEPERDFAMIVDIGGGSTELSWVKPKEALAGGLDPPIIAWRSTPLGVVVVAEDEPEPEGDLDVWYETLVERLAEAIRGAGGAEDLHSAFEQG